MSTIIPLSCTVNIVAMGLFTSPSSILTEFELVAVLTVGVKPSKGGSIVRSVAALNSVTSNAGRGRKSAKTRLAVLPAGMLIDSSKVTSSPGSSRDGKGLGSTMVLSDTLA